MTDFKTAQESFWAGEFGNEYIARNEGKDLLACNLDFFGKALKSAGKIGSLIEFGANIGMNLKAVQLLHPSANLTGIEINKNAAMQLAETIGEKNVFNGSIYDYETDKKHDVSLIKTVLIHINPEMLPLVYEKLYNASSKYILIAEYYNPVPVIIKYRGHEDRLFKRDFAGEMLDKYSDLKLVDYGFCYIRDAAFPQDDITWFLLEKKG